MSHCRLPAEWEAQSGILLTWPHDQTDWLPILAKAEQVFTNICRHTSHCQKVLIVARDDAHQAHISNLLADTDTAIDNIIFGIALSNDSWSRDHGPITVMEDDAPKLLDFQFNGWGKKYRHNHDNQITFTLYNNRVFQHTSLKPVNLVLEGGAIDCNGNGSILTTQCLLTATRNPNLSQAGLESYLRENMGIEMVHWLSHKGLAGDDTDGHIDTLARFTSENTIVYNQCTDKSDREFDDLQDFEHQLRTIRNTQGQAYELIPLPLPAPVTNRRGDRLPATYANFLIVNNAVLVPTYKQDSDDRAITILEKQFPGRKIIAIDCLSLIEQHGSLHCITMQFPQGVL